jgi:hypothetical protein
MYIRRSEISSLPQEITVDAFPVSLAKMMFNRALFHFSLWPRVNWPLRRRGPPEPSQAGSRVFNQRDAIEKPPAGKVQTQRS